MSREELIQILNENNPSNCIKIISNYCIDRGKNEDDVSKFLNSLIYVPQPVIMEYVQEAIDWYILHYSIHKVIDIRTNRVIHFY